MGKTSRTKGRAYEQRIARIFRETWPGTIVRRSSQAERAFNSDIFVENGPMFLQYLWLELQDARNPTPIAKLEQAERDIAAIQEAAINAALATPGESQRYIVRSPVVIWHRLAERTSWVTMRSKTWDALRGVGNGEPDMTPLTMDLVHFLGMLKRRCAP